MVTFWEAGAAMFVKAINNVLSLSRGMPKLNSIGLVGDYLYSRMAEKRSSRKLPAVGWNVIYRGLEASPFRPQPPDAERLGVEEHHVPAVAARDPHYPLVLGQIRLALL